MTELPSHSGLYKNPYPFYIGLEYNEGRSEGGQGVIIYTWI